MGMSLFWKEFPHHIKACIYAPPIQASKKIALWRTLNRSAGYEANRSAWSVLGRTLTTPILWHYDILCAYIISALCGILLLQLSSNRKSLPSWMPLLKSCSLTRDRQNLNCPSSLMAGCQTSLLIQSLPLSEWTVIHTLVPFLPTGAIWHTQSSYYECIFHH